MEDYLRPCFSELYQDDGLVVLARGLGLDVLCGKFMQYYASQPLTQKRDLVLCINATGREQGIRSCILSHDGRPDRLPKIINNEVTSQERAEMYEEGGCHFITSRILIVDLLDNTLDSQRVKGLLIYDAHRISDTSIESFVIRVYRENNRTGFIKAFSEDPESLQAGFGKVERVLRTLFVKKLFLWPRFRLEVVDALEKHHQPEVIEMSLRMTQHMKAIQSAVLVCMNTCLAELKKSCPTLDTAQMTLENGLFASFDMVIKSALDPEWHRIPFRTKQIVNDLGVLRKLLDYLVRYDAFSFYYLLLKLQVTSQEQTSPSLWLTTEAANKIFQYAKERVYLTVPKRSAKVFGQPRSDIHKAVQQMVTSLHLDHLLEPVLECPPKWKVLLDTIKEIRTEFVQEKNDSNGNQSSTSANTSATQELSTSGRVLLIVRDDLAASQLRDCLIHGAAYVMDQRFRWFISQQCADLRRKQLRFTRLQHQQQESKRKSGTTEPVGSNNANQFAGMSSSGASTTRKPAVGNAGRAGAAASVVVDERHAKPEISSGHELMSELVVHELLQPHGTTRSSGHVATDALAQSEVTGGYLNLGLSETEVRRLSQEAQSLLLQEKVLKMTPPVVSRSHTPFGGRASASVPPIVADDLQSSALSSGQKRSSEESTLTTTSARKKAKNSSQLGAQQATSFQWLIPESSVIDVDGDTDTAEDASSKTAGLLAVDADVVEGHEREYNASDAFHVTSSFLVDDLMVEIVTHEQMQAHYSLLRDWQPRHIVLYDAEVRILRQIEAYQSSMPLTSPLRVHFLVYEGSTEEHRYVAALAKEKKAFESLILTKEHMVISLPDHPFDVQRELAQDSSLHLDSRSSNSKAGQLNDLVIAGDPKESADFTGSNSNHRGSKGHSRKRKVVVDVREFRSSLPALLHAHHCQLLPRTLYIGDYVLSPDICVERKGISDLFQSFASGRLYNQIEAMSRYYKYPVLLIEFSPDKSFCLIAPTEIGSDISSSSIISKLVLLTQAFPHLRILWSRGPQQTAALFQLLVVSHAEVDVQKAVSVGSVLDMSAAAGETGVGNTGSHGMHNQSHAENDTRLVAQEILLSLPGINVHNYRSVMQHVTNIAELGQLSEAELVPLVGPVNARKLRAFFTQRYEIY